MVKIFGFKVWGVPIMIGVYWAVLVIVTSQIAKSFFQEYFFCFSNRCLLDGWFRLSNGTNGY